MPNDSDQLATEYIKSDSMHFVQGWSGILITLKLIYIFV